MKNNVQYNSKSQFYPEYLKEIGSSGILVSRDGTLIINKNTGKVVHPKTFANTNYLQLTTPICIGLKKFQYVHELVVAAWEPTACWGVKKPRIHHCDQNTMNNNIDNLVVLSDGDHIKLHHHIGKRPVSKTLINELLINLKKDAAWDWFDNAINNIE